MFLSNSELLLIKFENGEKHVFVQSSNNQSNSLYRLGQKYNGGIIFYIDESGEHGLIAASEDIGGLYKWGRAQRRIGASDFKDGKRNTEIMNQEFGSGFAGGKCADLNVAGYDDWYLPAIDELERLFRNRSHVPSLDAIGRTRNRFDYVSSTEFKNRNDCWAIHFSRGGKHFYYNKRNDYSVRCVQKF
jgi:hypothetical protein